MRKFGFFNSNEGDRKYDAQDFGTFLRGLVDWGVFSTVGDQFTVVEASGMTVLVNPGKAWLLEHYFITTTSEIVVLDEASVLPRIDTVVIEMDTRIESRSATLTCVKGTPAVTPVRPTLIETDDRRQYPLADVYVPNGITEIVQNNITNRVGTADMPFITGLLQQVSIDSLILQWYSQFQTWLTDLEAKLDENVAANLQNQIDDLDMRSPLGRNLIINGDMRINQSGTNYGGVYFNQYGAVDLWYGSLSNAGTWTVTQDEDAMEGAEKSWLKALCTSPSGSLVGDSKFYLEHRIEGINMAGVEKGTPYAAPLNLSFVYKSSKLGIHVVEFIDPQNGIHICRSYENTAINKATKVSFSIPPETIYPITPDNTHGFTVRFWIVAGTDYTGGGLATDWAAIQENKRAGGQVNVGSNSNNSFWVTDVQLELGDVASRFENVPPEISLSRVQRYIEYGTVHGVCVGSTQVANRGSVLGIRYKNPKRTTPITALSQCVVTTTTPISFSEGTVVYADPTTSFNVLVTHASILAREAYEAQIGYLSSAYL